MWVRPRGFIFKSLLCKEKKFTKCLGSMNTIPKSLCDQDTHMPSVSKEKRKSLWAGCTRDTGSLLQMGRPASWWSFDAGATLELLKTYVRFKSHLPISWDFNHYFICLCVYMPLISHFRGASFLSSLQAFQFRMLKMWLIQLPLPSPTWLLSSVICSPARSDMGHTTGRQREAFLQVTFLPQESVSRRHGPLLHLCRFSSFSWPTCTSGGLAGSVLCVVVVKTLERSALCISKYATELIHWAVT